MQRLDSALAGFRAWDSPWELPEYIRRMPELTSSDRDAFEQVWSVALDPAHWRSAELDKCFDVAEASLRNRFPELSSEAVATLAWSASYQWR